MPDKVPPSPIPHSPSPKIFGIRHHGPGSARSLARALAAMGPDIILIEGPPDADDLISLAGHEEMKPPVALLVYDPERPASAAFYPFAEFSPEWRAIRFGLEKRIPVRFMDLPVAYRFAMKNDEGETTTEPADELSQAAVEENGILECDDPLGLLAQAAGFEDGERWWEYLVEHRRDTDDVFEAVMEAMGALRAEGVVPRGRDARFEEMREAHMRQSIRAARKAGYKNIAVVCGAWHAPAIAGTDDKAQAKADAELLKKPPKIKVSATWVAWTHDRLSFASGYGAGVESPGWYHHLWQTWDLANDAERSSAVAIRWMTKIAGLFRSEDLDASTAHVIEAVRLAESLAALRGKPLPALAEMNEAARAIFCFGDDTPMKLIHDRLIVGQMLGETPGDAPTVPLQQDLAREQKRLRFQPEATQKVIDLDLRKPSDLEKSRLLHRLNLLGIPWGKLQRQHGKKGTFHEFWDLQWQPEFAVRVVEMAVWGNTVEAAASGFAIHRANAPDQSLPLITRFLGDLLLAELPEAVDAAMSRLQAESALSSDIGHLMDALPRLAELLRYGNVRKADSASVGVIVDGLVTRVCVGLAPACGALDDDAAMKMFERISQVHQAITLLENDAQTAEWYAVLRQLADLPDINGLLGGKAVRILSDAREFSPDETATRLSYALSLAADPASAAAWIEGFLKGTGVVLLHDENLLRLVDEWVSGLPADSFTATLPLLARTFSTFEVPERRQMGERIKGGFVGGAVGRPASDDEYDFSTAELVLPVVANLLGIGPVI